jgi:4-nitrophenyl phosphatase
MANQTPQLTNFRALLLDLDGTLYRGDRVFAGVAHWLSAQRTAGRKIFFMSNNTSRSTADLWPKLQRMGLAGEPNEIWGALEATFAYIRNQGWSKLQVVATPSVCAEFAAQGWDIHCEKPEAVILTYDTTFTYEKWAKAHLALEAGAVLVATHPDTLCPTEDGFLPDLGALLAAFAAAGHDQARVIGKPYPTMVQPLLAQTGLRAEECLMVGDRLYTDIRMAVENKIPSALVLTGESKPEDVLRSAWRPQWVLNSILELQ